MSPRSINCRPLSSRDGAVSASRDRSEERGDRMDGTDAGEPRGLARPCRFHARASDNGRPQPGRADAHPARFAFSFGRALPCCIAGISLLVVLSACTSSSRPANQNSSTSGSVSNSATVSSPPAPSTSPAGSSSAVTSKSSTPTADASTTGSTAQSAVQTYLAYNTWVNHAAMNPTDPNVAGLANLASSAAYSDALKNLNSAIVWKGTPATPRVRVISVQFSDTVVNLTDCAAPGTLLPYYVATGKPVPLQTNSVPPPYATTAQVVRVKDHWSVSTASTDRGHTCSA